MFPWIVNVVKTRLEVHTGSVTKNELCAGRCSTTFSFSLASLCSLLFPKMLLTEKKTQVSKLRK